MSGGPRPCERQCKGRCGLWKHYSRFRSWRERRLRNGTVSVEFSAICRDCEQKARNEKKNADRPKAIIEKRARTAASKAEVSFDFFWVQMNYRALVPVLRALMTSEGLCLCCGHAFINERDTQIEHQEPPRFKQDWARLHTRNLKLACASCNGSKGGKPFSEWLDEEEGKRLSNAVGPKVAKLAGEEERWCQGLLFELDR